MGPGLVSHWLWQSALRMRGLFNQDRTDEGGGEGVVSIRLADAWPFQLGGVCGGTSRPARFNPPCGCVAFSTLIEELRPSPEYAVSIRLADAWPFQRGVIWMIPRSVAQVSIRLADAWPFQLLSRNYGHHRSMPFQSALRMRGLFNRFGCMPPRRGKPCFNPPCGCVAFSTAQHDGRRSRRSLVSIRLADAWPFQPPSGRSRVVHGRRVSIRLADAWPFQRLQPIVAAGKEVRFNPPCGCVAFSTCCRAARAGHTPGFQSALRMRGLFNLRGPFLAVSDAAEVSIRLADAWPFQPS